MNAASSWQDMGLYWAYRGDGIPASKPPTKSLVYAKVSYPNWKPEPMTMHICCGVFDGEKFAKVNTDEVEWHAKQGAVVTWPFSGEA